MLGSLNRCRSLTFQGMQKFSQHSQPNPPTPKILQTATSNEQMTINPLDSNCDVDTLINGTKGIMALVEYTAADSPQPPLKGWDYYDAAGMNGIAIQTGHSSNNADGQNHTVTNPNGHVSTNADRQNQSTTFDAYPGCDPNDSKLHRSPPPRKIMPLQTLRVLTVK